MPNLPQTATFWVGKVTKMTVTKMPILSEADIAVLDTWLDNRAKGGK